MRTRPGVLLPLLVVLLVAVPIFEVWLLIQVGQQIGVLPTLAILVVGALVGGWLLRREGTRAWTALTGAFTAGRMPTVELADAALVLVGGVLLMLPGFATDVLGLLCLLPVTRPFVRRLLAYVVTRRLDHSGLPVRQLRPDRGTVIEGEVVDPQPGTTSPTDNRVIRGEVENGRP